MRLTPLWPEQWRVTGQGQLGGVANFSPAMVLAGLVPPDPNGGIRILLVDEKGIGHPGSLTFSGDSAVAKPPCVNHPGMQRCEQVAKITAKADATTLFVQLNVSTRFMRNKTDRKHFLDKLDPNDNTSRTEKPTEWVEELLDVSLSLKRETDAAGPAAGKVSRP